MLQAVAWPGARPDAAASPYHAFAAAAPHILKKPEQWPGAPSSSSTVRLLWDEQALYVCWELHGKVASPVQLKENPTLQGPLKGLPAEQCSLLFDERVECFLWQPTEGGNPSDTYYAFEINHDGKALTNRARFGGIFGFDWDSSDAFSVWTDELPLATEADPSSASCFASRVVIAEFRWKALGFDITSEIRIGLHRAQHPAHLKTRDMDKKEMDALLNEMIWSSWVDPHDAVVNFHRPEMFGKLILKSGHEDESFAAARLLGSKVLRVLRSPKLLLDDCPPGSLLIRVKYASLCGSDFPPSSSLGSLYWDRDGFCGHEAIGVVLDSRSDRFAIGDAVLALPSSYFKAHASSRAEWFDENVLLENMPVRGGFAEIFTSHELYAYKISDQFCLSTRRLGSLIGQTVVILGQGQNGLMTTRLLSQMCLRHLIAVEPLEFRRRQARRFGAGRAVAPGEALTAVKAVAPKGADLVLEMETINEALDLVRSGGTVVAFGVPDDPVYNFHYGKFFRKNVTLMASVFPDPGVDFPAAVELLETGRFDTEGIITHTFPLVEIQKAFTLATEYQDDVIKVVLDLIARSYDAIIIGAGVIGNSIALELSRNGWRTLNIDKLRGSDEDVEHGMSKDEQQDEQEKLLRVLDTMHDKSSEASTDFEPCKPPEELVDFLKKKNLEMYASDMCNHENDNYGQVGMLMAMEPVDLMDVAVDCNFAKEDRKKLGELVMEERHRKLAAPSVGGDLFNELKGMDCIRVDQREGLQVAYVPFKEVQVKDYMYSFGEGIEPREHRCLLRVMDAQIPRAHVEEDIAKEMVVLVVGQTGAGKSTQIDGMLNFVLGIKWEEGIRFKVVDELQTVTQQSLQTGGAASQTDAITAYKIPAVKGSPVQSKVTIVDTPGFGDTRGLHFDHKIVDQMKKFFNDMSDHVDILTGVCFVAPASAARLTESQQYVWNAILGLFGKDIAENILLCFTFADGEKPQALEAVKAGNIPMKEFFKFNNSALFVDPSSPATDAVSKLFWDMGQQSMSEFFNSLAHMSPKSLHLSKQVMDEREQLEASLESLGPQVKITLGIVNSFVEQAEQFATYDATMKNSENFKVTVKVPMCRKHPTSMNTTSCTTCQTTCHKNCIFANDDDKARCCVMDQNGQCKLCPRKCHWTQHQNHPFIYEFYEVEEVRTLDDLKNRYDAANQGKLDKEKIMKGLENDMNQSQLALVELIFRMKRCRERLNEIAMRPFTMPSGEYLQQMIENEKNNQQPGWQSRIAALHKLKEHGRLLKDAEDPEFSTNLLATSPPAMSHGTLPEEPFLGYGLRLPQPLGAVRLFSWTSKADVGTVLILHGMEDDWLGNNGSEGLVPGGAAEIAQSLHEKGFSVVLLDSFFDGRRERLLEERNLMNRF
eukprot:g9560.t1